MQRLITVSTTMITLTTNLNFSYSSLYLKRESWSCRVTFTLPKMMFKYLPAERERITLVTFTRHNERSHIGVVFRNLTIITWQIRLDVRQRFSLRLHILSDLFKCFGLFERLIELFPERKTAVLAERSQSGQIFAQRKIRKQNLKIQPESETHFFR